MLTLVGACRIDGSAEARSASRRRGQTCSEFPEPVA